MLKILEIIISLFTISKSVEQLLLAPTDITIHVSISIYIHKTFVNLLSEIYGFG